MDSLLSDIYHNSYYIGALDTVGEIINDNAGECISAQEEYEIVKITTDYFMSAYRKSVEQKVATK